MRMERDPRGRRRFWVRDGLHAQLLPSVHSFLSVGDLFMRVWPVRTTRLRRASDCCQVIFAVWQNVGRPVDESRLRSLQ